MDIVSHHPTIEAVLSDHRDMLGPDFPVYRGHVYRVFNIAHRLRARAGVVDDAADEKLAIAAAFHDLGIWAAGTFDYLDPSARLADAHLAQAGQTGWRAEILSMITEHHKLRRHSPDASNLTEVFRQADLVDLSFGLIRFNVPRAVTADLARRFPNAGFQARLVRMTMAWWIRHPFNPLPMFKW